MEAGLPQGFLLWRGFLDEPEEQRLLECLRAIPLGSVRMHGVTARRRVAQFGWRYSFDTYRLTPATPIPHEFEASRRRAAVLAGVPPEDFSEALVTEYRPGAGIGWHRDAPHFGLLAGISLGAACRLRFRRGEGAKRETVAVQLPPRSAYLLAGAARSEWQHMIPPVRELRWSITFRTIRIRSREQSPANASG